MNQLDLKGRVAVITGGAQGIGYATAERMLASGASVVLWDMDGPLLAEAKASLGKLGRVSTAQLELTDAAAVAKATAQAVAEFGRIDILVNNAGITGGNATTWELAPEMWRRVIEVNLIAPYLVCHAVVPQMLKQGYGRIVNVASVAGKEGNPNASHYSASKAGLIALTKSLGTSKLTQYLLVFRFISKARALPTTTVLSPFKVSFSFNVGTFSYSIQAYRIDLVLHFCVSPYLIPTGV